MQLRWHLLLVGLAMAAALRLAAQPLDPGLFSEMRWRLAAPLRTKTSSISVALEQARALRKQTAALSEKASGDAAAALAEFGRKLEPVAGPAVSPEEFYNLSEAAPTSLLRLAVSLARFQGAVESADAAPTTDAVTGFGQRQEAVEQGLARWKEFLRTGVPTANRALGAAGLAPIRLE